MQDAHTLPKINIILWDGAKQEAFDRMTAQMGYAKDHDYFARAIERHILGELCIVVALDPRGECLGYCFLNWRPKYGYFKVQNIPEIQDLNVLRDYRGQGIGGAIIRFCEALARQRGFTQMGIGVGLDYTFGAAQRLYVKSGYIPDGQGICYDRRQVSVGEFRPIDENLSLMMVKAIA